MFTLQIYEHQHLHHAHTHASMCTNTLIHFHRHYDFKGFYYTKKVSPQLCWVNKYKLIEQKSVSGESYEQNVLSQYILVLKLTWTGNPTAPAEGKWEGESEWEKVKEKIKGLCPSGHKLKICLMSGIRWALVCSASCPGGLQEIVSVQGPPSILSCPGTPTNDAHMHTPDTGSEREEAELKQ